MKQEDELFDEFLRKKGNNANIQFTESDWLAAKDMLANDRLQKKNRKRFLLFFLTMLFIAFISAVTWNHVMPLNAADNKNVTAASSPDSSASSNNLSATTANNSDANNTNNVTVNTKDKNNTTITDNSKQSNNKQQKTAVNIKDYKTTPDKTKITIANNSNTNNTQSRKYKNLTVVALANSSKSGTELASPAEKEALIEEQNSDYLLMNSKKLIGFNVQLNTCDTCVQEKAMAYKIYKKQKQRARQQVWLETGLTYYNPNNAWYNPIDFYVGFTYRYFMGAKTFLSSGIFYSRINQNQQERIITEKTYSFGVNEDIKKLRTTRLDYMEIPLMLGYCITPKHSVQAGVSLMYVIESAEVLKTILSKEANKEKTDYLNGYRNHVNDIDWQINLSYQYYLRQNWLINTGFHYGLTNVTATDKNNIGLRLGGAYKF